MTGSSTEGAILSMTVKSGVLTNVCALPNWRVATRVKGSASATARLASATSQTKWVQLYQLHRKPTGHQQPINRYRPCQQSRQLITC